MKGLIKKILIEETENTVLVVFGGIRTANAEWMLEQIPESIKNSRTIITKEWDSDIQEVIDELNEIKPSRLEVTGFSAGGKNVFDLANAEKPNFVGLIDPAVPRDWSLGGFPPGTDSILFFDNSNWPGDRLKGIRERQLLLAEVMLDKGMTVVETDENHMDFPKIFFNTYIK
tara:strand:+ start:94 stop:609 length:516 start_codon:yes stop_codon:yes gene_type:complete